METYIEIPNENIIINREKISIRHTNKKICKICGTEFYYGQTNQITCGECHIVFECSTCGIIIITKLQNLGGSPVKKLIDQVKNKTLKESKRYCSNKCCKVGLHKNNGLKYCKLCKKDTKHLVGVGCLICHNEKLNKSIICKIHGYQDHSFAGECILCHNEKINQIKYCEKCGIKTMHAGNQCMICHNKKINKIKYYKRLINVGNKHTIYHNRNLNANLKYLLEIKNYCEKVRLKSEKIPIIQEYLDTIFKATGILGEVFPTSRNQDSSSWSKNKSIFEDSLSKKGIAWFVYAKITTNNILSVIGKSGSKLVNKTGCDLSYGNKLYTEILVEKCNEISNKEFILLWYRLNWTEQQSLKFENIIGNSFLNNNFIIINKNSHKKLA